MLSLLYILITVIIAALVSVEMFREKSWRHQLAMALILMPLILRILQIK
jgi:ABC-type molybdate transport system permease subunit